MQVGALAIGIGMFLIFPAIPWILFPSRRKTGVVATLAWAGVCIAWALTIYGTEAIRFLTVIILSSAVRVIAEIAGMFDRWREVRTHHKTCTSTISCGVDHQTGRIPYIVVAFLFTTFFLVLYAAWP
ncbi:hypothetical protein [Streptomyces sp. NPDC093707]|uniref:hypothetical protein n=1 Tax=Streptomyces sp. NPDC093707 TaxID=3154984 RepID=UPI00344F3576